MSETHKHTQIYACLQLIYSVARLKNECYKLNPETQFRETKKALPSIIMIIG